MQPSHVIRIPVLGILLLLLACGDDGTGPSQDAVRLEVTPADVALRIGETRALSVAFVDAQGREVAAEGAVKWTSADENVAVVDDDGEVRGVASGSVKITASSGALSGDVDVRVLLPTGELETDAAASATDRKSVV